MACNKVDITGLEDLEQNHPEKRALVAQIEKENVPVMQMSTLTQKGVMEVKKEVSDGERSVALGHTDFILVYIKSSS